MDDSPELLLAGPAALEETLLQNAVLAHAGLEPAIPGMAAVKVLAPEQQLHADLRAHQSEIRGRLQADMTAWAATSAEIANAKRLERDKAECALGLETARRAASAAQADLEQAILDGTDPGSARRALGAARGNVVNHEERLAILDKLVPQARDKAIAAAMGQVRRLVTTLIDEAAGVLAGSQGPLLAALRTLLPDVLRAHAAIGALEVYQSGVGVNNEQVRRNQAVKLAGLK